VVNGTVAVSSAVSISETSTQQLTFKNKELCKAGKYRQLRISQAMTSCLRPLQYHREREDHEKPSEQQQIMFFTFAADIVADCCDVGIDNSKSSRNKQSEQCCPSSSYSRICTRKNYLFLDVLSFSCFFICTHLQ
jgi:hypothetical protein